MNDLIARAVRSTRARLAWSQRELSRRSGVPQSAICRIESARWSGLRFADVDRLFAVMGIRYRLEIDPPRIDRRSQSDFVHARCSAYVGRRLTADGWLVAREVEIGDGRSRGWIDLLAYHPGTRWLLVIEIKTETHDIGQIERSMNWYEREAMSAARRLGWSSRQVGSALLVLGSTANDTVLAANRDLLAAAFPGRARGLHAALTGAAPPMEMRSLAMIDPRSHRASWVRPTRLDGRHSPAPYQDYADAARRLGESRRRGRA